jgi:transposase
VAAAPAASGGQPGEAHPPARRQGLLAQLDPSPAAGDADRKAKGSAGGRPPAFDPRIYRHRNTIERGFNRLKQWRGIATRYDKYATTYLGGVILAALVTYHRAHLADTP